MEDPEARKARLKKLREAAQKADGQQNGSSIAAGAEQPGSEGIPAAEEPNGQAVDKAATGPALRFRNYAPRDAKIQHDKVAPVEAPQFKEPPKPEDDDDDEDILTAMAPKKANWDLKREIAPKLEKLERRTQRAMIRLLQEEEQRRQQEAEDEGE